MTYQEILEELCYYDPRNPDCRNNYEDEEDKIQYNPNKDCSCDNCFYGRTKLANELLKYIKDDKLD